MFKIDRTPFTFILSEENDSGNLSTVKIPNNIFRDLLVQVASQNKDVLQMLAGVVHDSLFQESNLKQTHANKP